MNTLYNIVKRKFTMSYEPSYMEILFHFIVTMLLGMIPLLVLFLIVNLFI